MDEHQSPFFWLEEYSGKGLAPVGLKRKAKSKKLEFVGWGSKPLIEFLESIGKDTTKQISQHDVTDIIGKYVIENNLLNPAKKKRVLCDERLHSIFGRKTISRIKIYDLLETHYAENQDESDVDFFLSSDEDIVAEEQKSVERKAYPKKKVPEKPKSCFAAIVPHNINLVYLKKSLVQDLLNDPENFKVKVEGSIVRIKSDPSYYLQKNTHMLVVVKDVDVTKTLLRVSNFVKDVSISMLSDDNFSQEECEDLLQRVKNGLLKRPTVVELEAKARLLHEDITNHRLAAELTLLQKLIDRANEKGWRKESFTLFEYMERRELLQTPAEQSRLLLEVPHVIADEMEVENAPQDLPDDKQGNNPLRVSTLKGTSEILNDTTSNGKLPTSMPLTTYSDNAWHDDHEEKQASPGNGACSVIGNVPEKDGCIQKQSSITNVSNTHQVIDLSDDEEDEDLKEVVDVNSLMWHYADPQGDIQGPFALKALKNWKDSHYFPSEFKVWKTGQSRSNAVLLTHLLARMFPG